MQHYPKGDAPAFGLSLAQQDIYFDQLHAPQSPHYNVGCATTFTGTDPQLLCQAHRLLIEKTEVFGLRLAESTDEDGVRQWVSDQRTTTLDITDLRHLDNPYQEAFTRMQAEFRKPITMQDNELFKSRLYLLDDNTQCYMMLAHHLIMDGFGFVNWADQMVHYYIEHRDNPGNETVCEAIDWQDIVEADEKYQSGKKYQKDREFWQQRLPQLPPPLLVPHYRYRFEPHAIVPSHRLVHDIDARQYAQWQNVAQESGLGLQPLMLAMLALYHGRSSERDTLTIGSALHNRKTHAHKQMLGTFTGISPVVADITQAGSFVELAAQINDTQKASYRYGRYPTGHLLRDLGSSGHHGGLFDIQLNYMSLATNLPLDGQYATMHRPPHGHESVPLVLTLIEASQGKPAVFELDVNQAYFSEQEGQRLLARYLHIINQVMDNPQIALDAIELLPTEEIYLLCHQWQGRPTGENQPTTVVEQFERQVRLTPQNTAVVFDEQSLDYQTLNRNANQLARALMLDDINPGDRVGVCLAKSPDLLSAFLAVLKLGATFVPLDPHHPKARLKQICDDAVLATIVCTPATRSHLDDGQPTWCMEANHTTIGQQSSQNLAPICSGQLAYLLYTSGSTGKPKGVAVGHCALTNHLASIASVYQLTCEDRIAQFASINVDPAVEQILLTLLTGATCVLIDHDRTHGQGLLDYLEHNRVSVADLPPSYFEQLMLLPGWAEQIRRSALRILIFGGEALNGNLIEQWQANDLFEQCQLINGYGPTEATITATTCKLTPEDAKQPPIGNLAPGRTGYVLDQQGQLLPAGSIGELYLGGAMLAEGYLGRPDLTANAFVHSPFNEQPQRLYRTGDKVRLLDDGRLVFIGRTDEQVKIRGQRIEPGEVMAQLNRLEGVDSAYVAARPAPDGELQLVAWVQCNDDEDLGQIRAQLVELLPQHMVPAHLMAIEHWPLTANDKIDTKALPEPDYEHTGPVDIDQPHSATEMTLVSIWAELLGMDEDKLSTTANFFNLGGHSLMAVQVCAAIKTRLGRALPVRVLFDAPQIRQLALAVDQAPVADVSPVETLPQDIKRIPLSFVQQQLWLADQLDNAQGHYHMQGLFEIQGQVSASQIEAAFVTLIERHPPLRTRIVEDEQGPYQQTDATVNFTLTRHDLSASTNEQAQQTLHERVAEDRLHGFDLSQESPIRASWFQLGENNAMLMFNLHHIAADGVSLEVLLDELGQLCRHRAKGIEPVLTDMPISYADVAWHQHQPAFTDTLKPQLKYWQAQLDDLPRSHDLPLDFPRGEVKQHQAGKVSVSLPTDALERLQALAREHQVTLFMLLHASLAQVLSRHSNSRDIAIGTPMANRPQAEMAHLMGLFVNTVVLRTRHDAKDVAALLAHAKTVNLAAQANQALPFEQLVAASDIERSTAITPLFQILFSLEQPPRLDLGEAVQCGWHESMEYRVKFDLDITAVTDQHGLAINWLYDKSLFNQDTVEQLAQHCQHFLEQLIATPNASLSQLHAPQNQPITASRAAEPAAEPLFIQFAEHCKTRPNALAIGCVKQQMSFKSLDVAATKLAATLQHHGVGHETLVGVCLPHSWLSALAVLAIWRAGAAFVPIDANAPVARRQQIIEDAELKLVIAEEPFALGNDDVAFIEPLMQQEHVFSPVTVAPSDLAYVIYTSGSTGLPKGVMVEHRQIMNLAAQMAEWPLGEPGTAWAWVANPVFDASMQAVCALMQGRPVQIVPRDVKLHTHKLCRWLQQHPVGVMDATPSMVQTWLEDDSQSELSQTLPNLIIGGEAISHGLWNKLLQWQQTHGKQALNVYGPTECTVNSTMTPIEGPSPSIGLPVGNTFALLLAPDGSPAPQGARAELYLGGDNVARGYLNREHLTAERFIQSEHGKLYKTGDTVRLNRAGKLEYIERADRQIKLRGYRIEPGEIEHQLCHCPGVEDAKVAVHKQALVAWVVSKDPQFDVARAKAQLTRKLPDHMVPGQMLVLAQWPLSASGKIDDKQLPTPEDSVDTQALIAPQTPMQLELRRLWASLLERDEDTISVEADFFSLGGHSLLATRLANRIRSQFGQELSLATLFTHNTITAQAGLMTEQNPVQSTSTAIEHQKDRQQSDLSHAQQRLWFIDQLMGASSHYNMVGSYLLEGRLSLEAWQQAVNQLVAEHEILRTRYRQHDGEPVGVIDPFVARVIEPEPVTKLDLNQLLRQYTEQPISLMEDDIFQTRLLRFGDEHHAVLLKVHHIAADGWSIALMMGQLNRNYHDALAGLQPDLHTALPQYADFAEWQNRQLASEPLNNQLDWWQGQLADMAQMHNLPLDNPRPNEQTWQGAVVNTLLDTEQRGAIMQLAEDSQATLFMVLQSAFALLLARYSGENDIVMGSPVAGRAIEQSESMLGLFVNTLVLRTAIDDNQSFTTLLGTNKERLLQAFDNQQVPFEWLVEQLAPERSMAANPLCQILFTLHNQAEQPLDLPDITVTPFENAHPPVKMDLELDVIDGNNGLEISWVYNTDLFSQDTIERMAANFNALLQALPEQQHRPVSELEILAPMEQNRLLGDWVARPFDLPVNLTNAEHFGIHQLFEQQVKRTPDATAVAMGLSDSHLSYRELNEKANQLAHHLQALGTSPDQPVGLYLERSVDLIVAIVATLKAGGAYVPIDPGYPAERIRYILEDSAAKVVLTQTALAGDLSDITTVCLDDPMTQLKLEQFPTTAVSVAGWTTANLAYLIYTSGSTGRPKGAMIAHCNVVNLLSWYVAEYDISPADKVLVFSSTSFDLTQKNLLAPLVCGSAITFATARDYDPARIVEVINGENITMTNCAPSAFYPLLDVSAEQSHYQTLASLKTVLLGGEPIDFVRFAPYLESSAVKLVNMYGPTECTDIACAYTLHNPSEHSGVLPIGTANRNVRLYVLKPESNTLLPQGVIGELCIGGAGVSRGYLNKPELSAEKFINDPFVNDSTARMYRTGDLVRWREDGQLVFIGRIDHQVKLRGMRIELGEIEAQLSELALVKQAVVLVQEIEGIGAQLVAYVVASEQGQQMEDAALKAMFGDALRRQLPGHMVPNHFVMLANLPLTPNSKVDRKALQAMFKPGETHYRAPQTPLQQTLCELWGEVLGMSEQPGIDDNFFALGGHSLLVAKLIHQAASNHRLTFSVKDLFVAPTIAQLANLLEQQQAPRQAITPTDGEGPYPLSFAQYRVWFVESLTKDSNQNNLNAGFRLSGKVDHQRLEHSFNQLLKNHTGLRTCVLQDEEQPHQQVLPHQPFTLDWHDLSELPASLRNEQAEQRVLNNNCASFDLQAGPLMRACLIRLGEDEHLLHISCHHIIADGWSQTLLFSQLFDLYDGKTVVPEALNYRDYVSWQQGYLASQQADEDRHFWQAYLQGCDDQLNLPFEHSQTDISKTRQFDDAALDRTIAKPLRDALHNLARAHNSTLFNVLHSAFALLLGKLTDKTDITTGIPVSGRDLAGADKLMGNLLNNLPVRSKLDPEQPFAATLAAQQANIEQVLSHQNLPFEEILAQTKLARSKDSTPLFQVFFNMLSLPDLPVQTEDFSVETDITAALDSKFKLSLYAADTDNGIHLHCGYNQALLSRDTVDTLMGQYVLLLEQIAQDPGRACQEYLLLAPEQMPEPLQPFDTPFVSVQHQFAQLAEAQPSHPALLSPERRYDYAELDAQAEHHAARLQQAGVVRGDIVGIFAERSDLLVIAVLATLKAGGAFMMLSRQAPIARVQQQLEIAPAKLLVTLGDSPLPQGLEGAATLAVSHESPTTKATPVKVQADDMAYIAFTSGTEGKPKAVMGRHSSLSAFMPVMAERFKLDHYDQFALLSGLVHDPLQRDMFTPLCLGGTLHVPPEELMNGPGMNQWLEAHQISVLHLTPSLAEQLLLLGDKPLPDLRLGFFVGERLSFEQVKRFRKLAPNLDGVNLYGSTETGRAVSCFEVKKGSGTVPLGQGIEGVQLAVLNGAGLPCGVGEPGQIGLISHHLSLGYYGETPRGDDPLYLTGDLGHIDLDGNVHYLGRRDTQLKIRGFRVETAEIVHQLEAFKAVEKAAVIAKTVNDDTRLFAFVTGIDIDMDALHQHLAEHLPQYMLPSAISQIDQLPLTENGKLDSKALLAQCQDMQAVERAIVKPANDIEQQLLALWQPLLDEQTLSTDDDFFAVGGHSLLATRLLAQIRQQFAVDIPFADFFADSRIQTLGAFIRRNQRSRNVLGGGGNKQNKLSL